MPEELVVILVILIGAIWLLVKICQGIAAALASVRRTTHAAAARETESSRKSRDSLRQFVHALNTGRTRRFREEVRTCAYRSSRKQKDHQLGSTSARMDKRRISRLVLHAKLAGYSEMYVDDIDAILTPNSDSSTWSTRNQKYSVARCKYPSAPPTNNPDKLTVFPTLIPDLKTAVFEIDAAHISEKDVARYFSDEQIRVLRYNNRRADLITNTAGLNSAIEEWNQTNRISWEGYVAESKQMEEAELLAYQKASEPYIKTCGEERSYFKRSAGRLP